MKINILAPSLLISISGLISMSCTANQLPKVTEPMYQSYDFAGEKGYDVSFGLSHDSIPATSIVINRIQRKISADDKVGLKYRINVISQSRKILGFKPMITDKENGIFFRSDTAEIFKPVDFKLRQK